MISPRRADEDGFSPEWPVKRPLGAPARRKGGLRGLSAVLSNLRAPRLKSEIVQTHVLRLNKISLARGRRMFLARWANKTPYGRASAAHSLGVLLGFSLP